MKKSAASSEASPYKSVAEELERLRKTFRTLSQRYTARVESEIAALRDTVLAAAEAAADGPAASATPAVDGGSETANGNKPAVRKKAPRKSAATLAAETSRMHDMRDMLTLLRTFEISSGVAKRRDFKLVENVLEELQLLVRRRV